LPIILFILLKQTNKIKVLCLILLIFIGIAINFSVIWFNNLAAGLFAPQDIDIFRLFVNKPYTKVHAVAIGIGLALLFKDLNEMK